MKALILTAGLGRRMQPLTDHAHKTLLEIAPGQTILGRILESLAPAGVTEVVIVTGYRAEEVRAYVDDRYPELNVTFVHNARYHETNNIHSMALAFDADSFDDGVLIIESDLIYDGQALATVMMCPHANAALLDAYRPGMDGTVVRLDNAGTIIDVIPGNRQGADFDFSDTFKTLNVYRFSGEFCTTTFAPLLKFYSGAINDNCYYELILGMLISMGHADVHGVLVPPGSWAEVDDPVDLHHARFMSDPANRRDLLDTSWGGYWGLDMIDFAFIRNMHYPTPQVVTELRLQLPELMATYGSSQVILDQKIAWFLGAPARSVVALNGAAQFFPWAARQWEGCSAWVPAPTFGEWNRVFPHAHHYLDDGRVPVELPTDVEPGSVVVVVNPNNPTGTTLATEAILDRAASAPEVTFVVDESFIHFSGQPSMVGLLEPAGLANVVVLQSLSKALGVPGVRIGFAHSLDRGFLDALRRDLPIWNMNSIAEKFIELLLKNRQALADSFAATVADRDDLVRRLGSAPVVRRVVPSGGNFVLAELVVDAQGAAALADTMLTAHGLYVKDVSGKFSDGAGRWRLAVRGPCDHEVLVGAMVQEFPGA